MIADRYELHEEIGTGGMGTVYRAIDTRTEQVVAVKAVRAEVADPVMIQRFVQEGEALRNLDHPNIVKLLDVMQHDGRHYLVMEYMAGGSLQALLHQQGQLPLGRAMNIALDLSDALTRAHRLNIIHRDIKPANVLLSADGTPRLTDFGHARLTQQAARSTEEGAVIGTLHYLSPEVCDGKPSTELADIWGLGVVIFEMVTGRRPFDGDNMLAVLTAILREPVPDLAALRPGVPGGLIQLLHRMLTKNPMERISSVRLVGAELEALLKGITTGQFGSVLPAAILPNDPTRITSSAELRRHNLPSQPTTFIGREAEIADLQQKLGDPECRLLTLIGPGGIGKTRLALEMAERCLGQQVDGVYVVNLAPLREPDELGPTIAAVIGCQFYEGQESPRDQLLNFLRGRNLLLVLDNFEHLLGNADIVSDMLGAAPRLKIIATSREALRLQWEWLHEVNGLPVPPEDSGDLHESDAVRLFLERAERVRPHVADECHYVAEICRLLEGMPLALELAAAWLRIMSCEELLAEVRRSIDILISDRRDITPRHRSVRAVLQQSWSGLDESARQVLMHFSIFEAPFSREAAHEVAGATPLLLKNLVDKSLLRMHDDGTCDLHMLVRQFAAEMLSDTLTLYQQAHERHSTYFCGLLQAQTEALKGAAMAEAQAVLSSTIDDIHAAWNWAVSQRAVNRIRVSMQGYCLAHAFRLAYLEQGIAGLSAAIETCAPIDGHLAAQLRTWRAILYNRIDELRALADLRNALPILRAHQDNVHLAYALGAQCEALGRLNRLDEALGPGLESQGLFEETRDQYGLAETLRYLGYIYKEKEEPAQATTYYMQSLELGERIGHPGLSAQASYFLGIVAYHKREFETAIERYRASLTQAEQVGLDRLRILSLIELGRIHTGRGEYQPAHRALEKALSLARRTGHHRDLAEALQNLSETCSREGDYKAATDYARQALQVWEQLADKIQMGWACFSLYMAAQGRGELETAEHYVGAALGHFRESGYERGVAVAQNSMGYDALFRGDYEAARTALQEAIAFHEKQGYGGASGVYVYGNLGHAYAFAGDVDGACKPYLRCLTICAQSGEKPQALEVMGGVARMLAHSGDKEQAAQLLAFCFHDPALFDESRQLLQSYHDELAAELPADVFAQAQQIGKTLDYEHVLAWTLNYLERKSPRPLVEQQVPLTAREREVLTLMADDLPTADIAARLGIAESTVRRHVRNICAKLEVNSRLHAITKAHELGLVK